MRTLGFGRRVRPSGGGLVVRREVGFRSSVDSVTQQVLFIEEADTVVLAELRRAAPQRVTFDGCPRFGIDLGPIFNPEAIWNASAERVGTHTSPGYRVDVFEGTRLALSIRREMETRVTEDDALEEARQLGGVRLANRSCEFDPEEQLRKRGWVETLQPVGRIAIAEDGSIWARRNAVGGEDGPIDVFAADGSYLGTLDEEAPFPMAFGPEGTFVAKHVDDLGVERLTMYEIRRGDGGR